MSQRGTLGLAIATEINEHRPRTQVRTQMKVGCSKSQAANS